MWHVRLDESQAGIKTAEEMARTSDMQIPPLMAESEEELKSLLMKMKEESEKTGLQLNIQKTKIMASGPIPSWQMDGDRLHFGAPKSLQMMTAAMKLKDTCSLEGKLQQT